MPNSSEVIVIGQFPPPVSGFSYITACVADELRYGHTLRTFDLSCANPTGGLSKHLSRLGATLRACVGLVNQRRKSTVSYIACEGGLGILYTLATATLSSALGYRLFLHHHSYAYIDRSKLLMRALLAMNPSIVHIFLCDIMQRDFEVRYACKTQAIILSNAAFVPAQADLPCPHKPLVLGHLSNLTREKGLYLFLDLLRQALAEGREVRGILAGPVALAADRQAITEACRTLGDRLDYRGPLYGDSKDSFYRDTDIFVFPTQYANEAQPTVLFEALAAGCKIVSFERGCIVNQVCGDGLVVPKSGDFVARTLEWIASEGPDLQADRLATIARYRERHLAARDKARTFLDESSVTP